MNKEKILEMLGNASSMFLVKAQVRNIVKKVKDGGLPYYLADIRYVKTSSNDFYGVNFNVSHVCFSSDAVVKLGIKDETMKMYKNNECLMLLSVSASIKTFKKDDNTYKLNNVQYFVDDIELIREIDKPVINSSKVVNI